MKRIDAVNAGLLALASFALLVVSGAFWAFRSFQKGLLESFHERASHLASSCDTTFLTYRFDALREVFEEIRQERDIAAIAIVKNDEYLFHSDPSLLGRPVKPPLGGPERSLQPYRTAARRYGDARDGRRLYEVVCPLKFDVSEETIGKSRPGSSALLLMAFSLEGMRRKALALYWALGIIVFLVVVIAVVGVFYKRKREILRVLEWERHRIARDLHDEVLQVLKGAAAFNEVAVKKIGSREGKAEVEKTGELIDRGMDCFREAIHLLSADSIARDGLLPALESLSRYLQEVYHVRCPIDCPRPFKFKSREAAAHVFQIVREAVYNAVRHGKADLVRVAVQSPGDGTLRITVVDNGKGFSRDSVSPKSLGLKIMEHRAHLAGGRLRLESAPGRGTTVALELNGAVA